VIFQDPDVLRAAADRLDGLEEIVEEVVRMFDEARERGLADIRSCVGSRFEARCRAALGARHDG
jgi:hypothetical protein